MLVIKRINESLIVGRPTTMLLREIQIALALQRGGRFLILPRVSAD
jgi:hypothetical protein